MPHKHNADRRHHIPKMSFKVQNWPAYEAGLRRRGSLTLWIEDAALECWQTSGPSGQARFKDAAIQTSLMLRTAFKLALRQTEGLMTSVLTLMGLTLSAPDRTTVSRRAVALPVIQPAHVPLGPLHVLIDSTGLQVYGAGQWLEAKHGAKSRRTWRKLHLANRGRYRVACQAMDLISVDLFEGAGVLAAVKDKALARGPAALLDLRCARRRCSVRSGRRNDRFSIEQRNGDVAGAHAGIARAGSNRLPVFNTPKQMTKSLRMAATTICLGLRRPALFRRATRAAMAGL